MLKIGSNINAERVDGSLHQLRQDLDGFLKFGLTAAEISVCATDVIRNGRLEPQRLEDIVGVLERYPFCYSVHAPNPLNLMNEAEFDLHVAVMRASLEFSEAIAAKVMVYHPGRFQAEETFATLGKIAIPAQQQQQLLEREAETLQHFADQFPSQTIALENARPYRHLSPFCYAEFPAQLREQVARINRPNVGLTLDFGHLHMAARHYGFSEEEAVKQLAPWIRHCHLHDNFGLANDPMEKLQPQLLPFGRGDLHLPIGWGDIDFVGLCSLFLSRYRGLLITELRSRYFNFTGESAANLVKIARHLQAA